MTIPLFDKRPYSVALRFRNLDRIGIDAVMTYSEYTRLARDYRAGKTTGTYKMLLDNVAAELTFPLQEIDTIHAALEAE